MSLGFANTLVWSFYSLIPSLRILALRGAGGLRRSRTVSFSFSFFFYKQSAVMLRLGSLLNPGQFIELFTAHLSRAGRFSTFISFFLPRPAFVISQALVSHLQYQPNQNSIFQDTPPTAIDCLFDAAW